MKDMKDILQDNAVLFAIVVIGACILGIGSIPPHSEMLQALGAAFIIAGGVGIYMMLATRQVAKKLHQRFNEQNDILKRMDESSGKQTNILKEIASSQKETSSSLKDMTGILKRIENKL